MASRALVIGMLLASSTALADPALTTLERALPKGWSMLATDNELVIRHDHAVYTRAASTATSPATGSAGTMVELDLRFKLEPRWPAARLAAARAQNQRLAADLSATRTRLNIDAIPVAHGAPQPTDDDQRRRLAEYQQAERQLAAKQQPVPTCTLGEHSLFDGPQTYAKLDQDTDPPHAATEARAVAELVKTSCRAE